MTREDKIKMIADIVKSHGCCAESTAEKILNELELNQLMNKEGEA